MTSDTVILPEIDKTKIVSSYTEITAFTAAVSSANIKKLYHDTPAPSNSLKTDWKHHLDGCATTAMEQSLNKAPFQSISVGSEGEKEASKVGIAAPCLANQNYGENGKPPVTIMTDVLEGTTFASRNAQGASSVLAGYYKQDDEFGIKPSEDGLNYLFEFFGPSQANEVIDPLKSHTENLKNLLDALNLKDPNDLIQITLDPNLPRRACNHDVANQAIELGIDVRLIEHGDFIGGLRAISQPQEGQKFAIVVGRGGYEECIMNTVAAKAVGGFSQIQHFDINTQKALPGVLNLDEIVSSDQNRAFVLNSFVTNEDLWFNKPGVKLVDNKYIVTTLITANNGLSFVTNEFEKEVIDSLIFPYGTF